MAFSFYGLWPRNIYAWRRFGKVAFLFAAAVVVTFFLFISDRLIKDLAVQERERMQIWADATKEIINITSLDDEPVNVDIEFLLKIISSNTTIPVLLTDENGNILQFRNVDLPDEVSESDSPADMSERNQRHLQDMLGRLRQSPNVIDIDIAPGVMQHLYYEDSTLLKRLSYYPYVQIAVMLIFIMVMYFALLSTKKAEQNKVWVGLSKETAHQLGTPISSLMAWLELLPDMGVDADTVGEISKDVQRLSTIASRFSKIGSEPKMEPDDVNAVVGRAAAYMRSRVSPQIAMAVSLSPTPLPASMSAPLFEWVMENLIKNAVDAMEGHGALTVNCSEAQGVAVIDVTDTGKGISRKNFKNVFSPGFTTKKRGWGLGLTLAKRIIEQYHKGKIYVKASNPGIATTFRIELPLTEKE